MQASDITMSDGNTVDNVDVSELKNTVDELITAVDAIDPNHDHSGSSKGESLYNNAIMVKSGYADDNETTFTIDEKWDMDACSITFGLISMDVVDGTDRICTRICKDEDNHNYIIRCIASTRSAGGDGSTACSTWFDDDEPYKDDPSECSVTHGSTEACRIFYQITCIQNY